MENRIKQSVLLYSSESRNFSLLLKEPKFTVFTDHMINKGISKVTQKKHYSMITFWIPLRLTYQDLSLKADTAREKNEFEVIHVLIKMFHVG